MQPVQSNQTAAISTQDWEGLTVEYGRLDSVGDFDFAMPKNGLSVAFLPHEEVVWSVDGRTQTTGLPAGSVFVYGDREFVWHRRKKPSEYVNLNLDHDLLEKIAKDHDLSSELEHKVIFQDPTILHIAQLLKAEALNGGIAGNLYVESLRNLLAVHLIRNHTGVLVKPIEVTVLDGLKLNQLKDYIEEHLADELSIATLAALIPMSQFHFARAFKGAIGEPPHRYITQRRIDRAKMLLSVTKLSAAEIAYQVGFSNQSHFTAQFRKTVGMTPKQFRSQA
ncbi:helix-turn-helix domain-containing protein [Leptolyngbya sp. AN03gr2]|uniref:helix-turn-helix domain-containing protein n=1 Tax=unclassified Leptolyngbya TaxID=2650499 RepID=UPI003D30FF80